MRQLPQILLVLAAVAVIAGVSAFLGRSCSRETTKAGSGPFTRDAKPEVVEYHGNSSVGLNGANYTAEAKVHNGGGDGTVIVRAVVRQRSDMWQKKESRLLHANETASFTFPFPEVRMLGGPPQLSVEATPSN